MATLTRSIPAVALRRDRWSPVAARVFVYALVLVQLGQGVFRAPDGFTRSYWLVTYDEGFVRRGLTGTVLAALTGRVTDTGVQVACGVIAAVCVGSILVLVELLLRRRTSTDLALAVLLDASPFVLDQVLLQRRPDLLAVPVLVGLGLGLARLPHHRGAVTAVAGAGFGVLCLVHEGTALTVTPLALALLLVLTRTSGLTAQARLAALLLTPSAVALGAVLVAGLPSASDVAALRARSPLQLTGETMFDYLDNSTADSLRLVADYPKVGQAAMVVLGVALLAVHWLWVTREAPPDILRRTTTLNPRLLATATLGLIALGAVLTFALGVDWLRWFAELGTTWLVATALLHLAQNPTRDNPGDATQAARATGGPVTLPRWIVVVAVYLAVLAPLAQSLGVRDIISFVTVVL